MGKITLLLCTVAVFGLILGSEAKWHGGNGGGIGNGGGRPRYDADGYDLRSRRVENCPNTNVTSSTTMAPAGTVQRVCGCCFLGWRICANRRIPTTSTTATPGSP